MKQLIPSTLTVAALAFSLLPAAASQARIATPVLNNAQLPRRIQAEEMDAQTYEREYRKAVIALEAEQHEFTGMLDFVKSLCLWFESPEERMRKNGFAVPEGISGQARHASVNGFIRNL
jgi:hypothetical protein